MSKESAITKAERARRVLRGLKQLFKDSPVLRVDGVPYRRAQIEALFRAHLAAIDEKAARYAAYRQAVAAERAIARKTNAMWIDLYVAVLGRFGRAKLPVLGMKLHRKPGPKTVAAKLAGVQKRAKKKRAG
jgi:hypothetical protein